MYYPLSKLCWAGGMVSENLNFGPDNYLESKTDLSFDIDSLYLGIGYSFSKDKNSEQSNNAYSFNLGNNFNDNFSGAVNYTFSPEINGYKYDTTGVNIALSDQRGGSNNDDFLTTLVVDFSQTNHFADVYIDTTTLRRKIHIDTTWTLGQNAWTLGLEEAFYRDTILTFDYTSFSYNKDIKNPVFQRYLDFILLLGGGVNLPGLLFSISTFPSASYNIGLTQYFSDSFSLSVNYNRVINYINNAMSFYYSLKGAWFLSDQWQLDFGYTLYIDEYQNKINYYSPGLTFIF